jgi:hypothetical protein
MRFHQFLTAVAVSTGLASCASAPPVTSAPGPATDQNVTAYPTMKLWTGTLNPTRSYNASAVASERQNAYGRVEVTVSPSAPTLSHVMLKVSVPNERRPLWVGKPTRARSGSVSRHPNQHKRTR